VFRQSGSVVGLFGSPSSCSSVSVLVRGFNPCFTAVFSARIINNHGAHFVRGFARH
jgi:hypothetical protein